MRRRKNKTPHQLSEEQEEYAMKEYLLSDCFLFKNALELLCKKLLGRDKEEIEISDFSGRIIAWASLRRSKKISCLLQEGN